MIFNISDKVRRNVLLSCDHGLMIVNRFDCNHEQVGHGQWLLDHGNTSTIEASKCYESIRNVQEPVIFDVGANIGTFTTWMAQAFPQGRVYCFEPQRAVFQQLNGNAAINNLYNVHAHNMALGRQHGKIRFAEPNYFAPNDFGTFSLAKEVITNTTANQAVVAVNTLDWFMDYYEIDRVDLIKIDVEGMDLDVLQGAVNTIERFKPVIFIEHCDNQRSIQDDITEFLDQFEYHYEVVGNNILCK
jgi:FkbM family methyltransferase